MASVPIKKVDKKVELSTWQIIKYQLLNYCYFKDIRVSDADLDLLTLLSVNGNEELTAFCKKLCDRKIFKSLQSARNALLKAERKELVITSGTTRKKIIVNPNIQLVTDGNILLDYKFLARATN